MNTRTPLPPMKPFQPFEPPKPTFEQKVVIAEKRLSSDIASVRYELAQTGGESLEARKHGIDLRNAIEAALKEGESKSRWSKDQTLAEKLERLPGAPRQSNKLTREEKEDMGLGAYIAGQWTEWGK